MEKEFKCQTEVLSFIFCGGGTDTDSISSLIKQKQKNITHKSISTKNVLVKEGNHSVVLPIPICVSNLSDVIDFTTGDIDQKKVTLPLRGHTSVTESHQMPIKLLTSQPPPSTRANWLAVQSKVFLRSRSLNKMKTLREVRSAAH